MRLYFQDPGWQKVRQLAATDHIGCCIHGYAEVVAALHRKLRENALSPTAFRVEMDQFATDCRRGAFRWLPLSDEITTRVRKAYETLPSTASLRAADAIHLACAAGNSFLEVYSNDQHLLAACPHFGLEGRNLI